MLMKRVRQLGVLGFGGLLLFLSWACGGTVEIGGGSGDTGGSSANNGSSGSPNSNMWISYCDTRASNCGIGADACKAEEGCAKALLRNDIEEFLTDCLRTACNEDECFAQIATGFAPTAAGQAFLDAWQTYITACPMGNDDVSIAGWIIADNRLPPFQDCLQKPDCAQAAACFEQVNAAEVEVCKQWL